METMNAGAQTQTTIEKLMKFVNQRPGLEFCNYGDRKIYFSEMREITNDRKDFYELLSFAQRRIGEWKDGKFISDLNARIEKKLIESSDRLSINSDGRLEYCTGQYFPTEYRPAASRILVSLIWEDFRNEKNADGTAVYKDGHEMRKAIRRNLSRRVNKNYFN